MFPKCARSNHTIGRKYVNIDRPKTSDSNWTFQCRFRDSSVRQYQKRCGKSLGGIAGFSGCVSYISR